MWNNSSIKNKTWIQFRDIREETFLGKNYQLQHLTFPPFPTPPAASTSGRKAVWIDCYTSEHVFTLNALGPMPEEVILFLLRSSLSKFCNPLNASSGMEVMELPRKHSSCVLGLCAYTYMYTCVRVCTRTYMCMCTCFIWRTEQYS